MPLADGRELSGSYLDFELLDSRKILDKNVSTISWYGTTLHFFSIEAGAHMAADEGSPSRRVIGSPPSQGIFCTLGSCQQRAACQRRRICSYAPNGLTSDYN